MLSGIPEAKWFFKSKTLIGALISVAPALSELVGYPISAGEADSIGQAILSVLDSVNEIVGLGLIVWGRATAKDPIKFF